MKWQSELWQQLCSKSNIRPTRLLQNPEMGGDLRFSFVNSRLKTNLK